MPEFVNAHNEEATEENIEDIFTSLLDGTMDIQLGESVEGIDPYKKG